VTNVTFSFETSRNTNPTRKSGGHGILCPPRLTKWREHVPRVPHQIAPMLFTHILYFIHKCCRYFSGRSVAPQHCQSCLLNRTKRGFSVGENKTLCCHGIRLDQSFKSIFSKSLEVQASLRGFDHYQSLSWTPVKLCSSSYSLSNGCSSIPCNE